MRMRVRWCVWLGMLASLAFGQTRESAPAGRPPGPIAAQPAETQPAPRISDAARASPPEPAPTLTNDQIKDLIRQVAEKDIENDQKQRDYTYIQREEEHKLSGKGDVTSTEVRTYEVMEIAGEGVQRLIAKNDQPLSAKDAAKEDEKIQKIIDKRKNESDSDREKRLRHEEKEREQGREFVKEVADAYNFTPVGVEDLDGRPAWVIDAQPRPGYQPHRFEAKFLPKFRFRVWIDQAESQWVKLDAECIDTVSIGLFLARIHKGSRVLIETTRVNDEVWLPKHVAVHVDGRLALLKGFNVSDDVTYKDYKKFRTATRIVGVEETK
jgi:hypothetical protein